MIHNPLLSRPIKFMASIMRGKYPQAVDAIGVNLNVPNLE
jgi:hypothetical protein